MQTEPLPRYPLRTPPPPQRPRSWLRWVWPLAAVLALGGAVGVGVASVISHPEQMQGLSDYSPSLVTQLYARDGRVFASFARERRVMLREADIPEVLKSAVLASEDAHFFAHGGIDAWGIARAAFTDLKAGKVVQGASTISMQLARSLFLSRERTWKRKIDEAFLAVDLEKSYTKQQILTLYLNLVNLGHGNYGAEAASRYYFNKGAKELALHEAATLVGIIPAPSRYSPYRVPDMVLKQRNRVLRRMLDEGFLKEPEYERAIAQPLLVVEQRPEESVAPYFAEEVRKTLAESYGTTDLYEKGFQVQTTLDPVIQRATEDAVRSWLARFDHRRGWRGPIATVAAADLAQQTLPTWPAAEPLPGRWYQGLVLAVDGREAVVKIGRKSYTLGAEGIAWTNKKTPGGLLKRGDVAWFRLDRPPAPPAPPAKAAGKAAAPAATPAVTAPLRLYLEQEPRVQGAGLVLENATGAVRALVGGWDFERNKFDRITQAHRQVGSSFKPFVYGAALEMGWTPSDTLLDAPTSFIGADGKLSYRPENYYHKHAGIVTLRRALEQSINVPAVKLLDLIGGSKVVDFAHRIGLKTPLPTWPSIALGSADLVPLEVASAYSTIANLGLHVEPYFIESVAQADGQVLKPHYPATYAATNPAVAYVLTHMMQGVVQHGTAYELASLPLDVAGKTGTTDDYTDAWFVGFTPRYTILTWIGYDLKKTLGNGMSGAVAALPMWKMIAESGLRDGWLQKGETFPVPPGVVFRDIDYYSGLLPAGGTRTVKEAFVAGTEPARESTGQWSTITSLPWFQQKSFYIPKEGEKMPGPPPPGPPGTAEPQKTEPPAGGAPPPPASPPPPPRPKPPGR
jgi:penicillin-binding protein 1A